MTAIAQLPTNLNANPRLSRWLRFDAGGNGADPTRHHLRDDGAELDTDHL